MDVNEVIENQTNDETIEETENTSETPENDEENTSETDKADNGAVDDPTSSNDGDENENFLGTFKTKEAADQGFKDAQAKITEQGNRIKELEKQLNINNANPVPNVEKEVEQVKVKANQDYSFRLKGLGVKYSAYIPNDAVINTIDDIVANLPPQQASQFTADLMNIQNECNAMLKNQIDTIYQTANTKFEEVKAKDKERYKDNEIVYNAWYNPPETIDQVAELVENVKKQAIADYIKEQAAKAEDEKHKGKLNTSGNSKAKFQAGHIFTREEIGKMTPEEFAKNEAEISKQVAAGQVL